MRTIDHGAPLDPQVAGVVAATMKDWAIENGATHFTHWFQPLTGLTAEKHDSLMAPDGQGGVVFCDLPQVPPGPSGKFVIAIMAAVRRTGGWTDQRAHQGGAGAGEGEGGQAR